VSPNRSPEGQEETMALILHRVVPAAGEGEVHVGGVGVVHLPDDWSDGPALADLVAEVESDSTSQAVFRKLAGWLLALDDPAPNFALAIETADGLFAMVAGAGRAHLVDGDGADLVGDVDGAWNHRLYAADAHLMLGDGPERVSARADFRDGTVAASGVVLVPREVETGDSAATGPAGPEGDESAPKGDAGGPDGGTQDAGTQDADQPVDVAAPASDVPAEGDESGGPSGTSDGAEAIDPVAEDATTDGGALVPATSDTLDAGDASSAGDSSADSASAAASAVGGAVLAGAAGVAVGSALGSDDDSAVAGAVEGDITEPEMEIPSEAGAVADAADGVDDWSIAGSADVGAADFDALIDAEDVDGGVSDWAAGGEAGPVDSSVSLDLGGIDSPDVSVPDVDVSAPDLSVPDISVPNVDVSAPDVDVSAPDLSVPDVSAPDVDVSAPDLSIPDVDVSAPDLSLPDVDVSAPDLSVPDVSVPDVDVSAPDLSIPGVDVSAPDLSLSDVDVSAPDLSVPDVDVPDVDVPDVDVSAPDLSVPDLSLPDVDVSAPDLSVPDLSLPDVDVSAPDLSVPDVSVPDVSLPDVDVSAPDLSVPDVSLPDVDVSAPDLSVPDVSLPDVDVSAPDLSAPDLSLPDVDVSAPDLPTPDFSLPDVDVSATEGKLSIPSSGTVGFDAPTTGDEPDGGVLGGAVSDSRMAAEFVKGGTDELPAWLGSPGSEPQPTAGGRSSTDSPASGLSADDLPRWVNDPGSAAGQEVDAPIDLDMERFRRNRGVDGDAASDSAVEEDSGPIPVVRRSVQPMDPSPTSWPEDTSASERVIVPSGGLTVEREYDPDSPRGSGVYLDDPDAGNGGEEVAGLVCSLGHLNAPSWRFCGTCGADLSNATPGRGPHPGLGLLLFDDGNTLPINTGYLIGRRPNPEAIGETSLQALAVNDESQSVSRNHAILRVDGWELLISDCGSANGTHVEVGDHMERLEPGVTYPLSDGQRVVVGTRWFEFRSAGRD
jgi:hypothetical protein